MAVQGRRDLPAAGGDHRGDGVPFHDRRKDGEDAAATGSKVLNVSFRIRVYSYRTAHYLHFYSILKTKSMLFHSTDRIIIFFAGTFTQFGIDERDKVISTFIDIILLQGNIPN